MAPSEVMKEPLRDKCTKLSLTLEPAHGMLSVAEMFHLLRHAAERTASYVRLRDQPQRKG